MLIVIEGVDSSGKATQTELLFKALSAKNNAMKLSFPDYESDSSALVKMYLSGSFGENANDVSPYAASVFYAADRYASYRTKWMDFYQNNGIIVCDRYTTSNMVHQAAKINSLAEKNTFLDWIYDLEYQKFALPQPNIVFFLDMPPVYANMLMKNRMNKFTGTSQKDIHESDDDHLNKAYQNAVFVAEKYNWNFISCVENNEIRSIESIHNEILKIVEGNLYDFSSNPTDR